ncbi:MAG: SDR family oxidoreductase [Armatimonadaceae bacterium]
MHVLFIGGTGLISTAIARQLIEAGHTVTCYNRGRSESRLPEGSYEVIQGDRKDYNTFEATFADKTYDVVVDMVAFHPDDTASAIRTFAGRCGQFMHCSTVCVYSGPPENIPTPETEPFHSPGGYGQNKIACEKLLFAAWEENGFPATILRPSHSYGEGGRLIRPWGPAEPFISRVRAGLPLVLNGDGTGLWASCHVDDVATGFIGLMGKEISFGEAYNITGEEWVTWNMYMQQVVEVVGGTFDPVYIPADILIDIAPHYSGGLKDIFAWTSIFDNSKIKRDGGWQGQTISWREGVRRTVAWMDANNGHRPVAEDEYEDKLIGAWRSGLLSALPRQQ